MKIVFLTTQVATQSTVVGRVFPLASEFQKMGHEVTIFLHEEKNARIPSGISTYTTGKNPFMKTADGKQRKSGVSLILTMKLAALRAAWGVVTTRPDVIIIVKPLPENTLAALFAKIFLWKTKVILDVDDFELFANTLTSLVQRAAIHASERLATWLSSHVVVATPFLYDHIYQMTAGKKGITLIPTGLTTVASRNASLAHTMLYIGSISASSGHLVDMLPEILAQVRKSIPDATLTLAGSGDDEKKLREHVHALGLDSAVTYSGRFSQDDVPRLVSSCSVLVDPIDASIVSRAKSSFRVALALATGTPIVTSSIGIRTQLIPEELHEKFFAKPEDVSSYASRIVECIHTPLSEGEKNLLMRQSEQYTWERLAKKFHSILV